MSPLQQTAQAVIDRWDAPSWKDQPHTAEYIAELRKALDAEIAQAVEPYGWMVKGVANEMRGSLDKEIQEQKAGHIGGDCHAYPVYLHPPQPQATTPVPAEVLEAIRRSGHALVKTQFGYRLNFIGAATAQGEKP